MVVTAYYIQRLSDGKVLAGQGVNNGAQGVYSPFDWQTLTGGQLNTSAFWYLVDLTQPYSSYSFDLENLVDSLPQTNGAWEQDLFRFLPIQATI